MLRRITLTARLSLIVLVVASVLGPAVILAGLHPRPSQAAVTAIPPAIKLAAPPDHGSWFAMNLAHEQRSFHPARVVRTGAPPINAGAGIVVDIDTGDIIWAQSPHRRMAPASTTKVLSALVALENFSASRPVTITPDALNQDWDESKMGLKPGEQLTVQELLTGMLMVSANDAATAIALDTVGDERFVGAMNAQVESLGLTDSHFATPVGLSAPGQYASPYDLAVIGAVAYDRYPLFRQLVGTVDLTLPASTVHQAYQLHNVNELLQKYPAAVGIKPGWTGDAGACLVGMAVRNGHRLIAVLMSANYPAATEAQVFDWAFATDGLPRLLPPPTPPPTPPPPAPAAPAPPVAHDVTLPSLGR